MLSILVNVVTFLLWEPLFWVAFLNVVIVESTYGVAKHLPREDREIRFVKKIRQTLARGGRVLLPVVALGRAQVSLHPNFSPSLFHYIEKTNSFPLPSSIFFVKNLLNDLQKYDSEWWTAWSFQYQQNVCYSLPFQYQSKKWSVAWSKYCECLRHNIMSSLQKGEWFFFPGWPK